MNEPRHLYELLVDFAVNRGAQNLVELPGCWEHSWEHDGMKWFVAIHCRDAATKTSTGVELAKGAFWIECNGWPVGLVDLGGWSIAAGSKINERAFRAALEVPVT